MTDARFSVSRRWTIAAGAVLALIAIQLGHNAIEPSGIDFISYWAAAKLMLAGTPALAYDLAAHRAVELQAAPIDGLMSYPYAPPFFFFIAPFGWLSFPVAIVAWVATSTAVFALVVRRFMPGALGLAFAFPPVLVSGIIGQNGLLSAAVMVAATALLGRRGFVAGMLFGLLAIKPQLAVVVPLLLLTTQNWRAIAGAVVAYAGLCLASLAAFGIEPWRGFFHVLPLYGQMATQDNGPRMASVYAALRMLGLDAGIAAAVHAVVAMAALWLAWRTDRRADLAHARGAALVVATALTSPYFYMYDQVMLVVAIVWALRVGVGERPIVAVYLLSLLAYVLILEQSAFVGLAPLAPLALLGILFRRVGGSLPGAASALLGSRSRHTVPRTVCVGAMVPAAGIEPAAP